MMTIELFISDATQGTEQRRELAERILRELTTEEGAPEVVLDKARELTHVLVHTPEVWVTGGPDMADTPRYLVRVTVPGSWSNTGGFSDHIIPTITNAVASMEDDTDRLTRQPHCVVQIIGLRERAIGLLGRTTTGTEITKLLTDEHRKSGVGAEAPEGYAVDPVCGMFVETATATITFTHDGVDYAFCAPGCRKVFVEEHATATS